MTQVSPAFPIYGLNPVTPIAKAAKPKFGDIAVSKDGWDAQKTLDSLTRDRGISEVLVWLYGIIRDNTPSLPHKKSGDEVIFTIHHLETKQHYNNRTIPDGEELGPYDVEQELVAALKRARYRVKQLPETVQTA
jgi:hypothetical protein